MQQNKCKSNIAQSPFVQTYFHGTKADLKIGELISVGFDSNYGQRKEAQYIYLTSALDAAIWGAELALGERRGRIYLVEATGEIESDTDLTDRKCTGSLTMAYSSQQHCRVRG